MLIEVQHLSKSYTRGSQTVRALNDVSLKVVKQEFVAIMGPSGSGKSSLLQIIGGLDRPTTGTVRIEGESIHSLSDQKLSEFRRRKLGFIFQFFNLLPSLTALENVCLPLLIDGVSTTKARPLAMNLLRDMHLADRADHRPAELSGGEMQRVAIARALITDPLVILADEPTGNLDSKNGLVVLELLRSLVKERQQTILMVTHDHKAAEFGTRLIELKDGAIAADKTL